MDATQFDRVAKAVGQGMARRRLLAGLLGAVLAGSRGGASAKRKGKGKRAGNKRTGPAKRGGGQPTPSAGGGGPRQPAPCLPTGSGCTRDNQCCGNNCFNFVCADKVSQCPTAGGIPLTCSPLGTGCCPDDVDCCGGPDNQCNLEGLCCAPNCAGRQCGGDGCGGIGTCGSCPPGATCDEATGQCSCGSANCNGCCGPNGTCQPGNTEQACGTGGAPCINCPGAQTSCQDGTCQPVCSEATCPNGCCDATGKCQPGDQAPACGRGGVRCVSCQAGQFCCSTPACDEINRRGQCACDSDSCPNGCCVDFTTCQPGTTNEFCGLGGVACLTCNPKAGQVCAEIEIPGGGDVERNCICTPETCPNGCCIGGPGRPGLCLANQAPQCGIGGALCQICANFNVCNAQGQCVCSPRSCPRCQTCNAGTGQCQPVVCPPPPDQCHAAGSCDPGTGKCSSPTVANGTPCADGNPLCVNGQCCTAGHEVVHGGCFQSSTDSTCPECEITRLCQCTGSVQGSGNYLCGERNNTCNSNQDCPFGQACASHAICISPC